MLLCAWCICAFVPSNFLRIYVSNMLVVQCNIAWLGALVGLSIVYICSGAYLTISWSICPAISCAILFLALAFADICLRFLLRFLFSLFLRQWVLLMVAQARACGVLPIAQGMFVPIPSFQWATSFATIAPILTRDVLLRCVWTTKVRLFGMCGSGTVAIPRWTLERKDDGIRVVLEHQSAVLLRLVLTLFSVDASRWSTTRRRSGTSFLRCVSGQCKTFRQRPNWSRFHGHLNRYNCFWTGLIGGSSAI